MSKENCIEVKTNAGIIRAYKTTDPGDPGICVMLQPKGCDYEIDLMRATVRENPEYRTKGEAEDDITMLVWGNTFTEDYTIKCTLKGQGIQEAVKVNCDNTECRNCTNHDYCDYENTSDSEKTVKNMEFGSYDGKPISWRVLEKFEDGTALIVTEGAVGCGAYNRECESITWEDCTLRKWLNSGFFDTAFTPEECAAIIDTEVVNDDNLMYGTPGGNDTVDKVFLLSIDEVEKYFASDEDRVCYDTEGDLVWWWLRSPGYCSIYAANVYYDGRRSNYCFVANDDLGVRPALRVNLKA